MGYDLSVYVLYGTLIENPDVFVKRFLKVHPDMAKIVVEEGYDINDDHDVGEIMYLIEDFLNGIGCISITFRGNKFYISSFMHEHQVSRIRDDVNIMTMPTTSEMKTFDEWCEKHCLNKPNMMTIIIDG